MDGLRSRLVDALARLVDPVLGARSLGGRWLSARGSDARGDARLLDGHSLGAGACADRKSD